MKNDEIEVALDSGDIIDPNILFTKVFDDLQIERLRKLYAFGRQVREIRVIPFCKKYKLSYNFHDMMCYFSKFDTNGDYLSYHDQSSYDASEPFAQELTSLLSLLNHYVSEELPYNDSFISETIGFFVNSYDPEKE